MKRLRKYLWKYFVPHRGNDHKPHILRERSVGIMLAASLLVFTALAAGSAFGPAIRATKLGAAIYSAVLVDLTNASRAANTAGTTPLRVNPLLTEAAQEKADDMATHSYFAHVSPDGKTPWYFFDAVGYTYQYAGENLAVDFNDSADVEQAWMNSPGHRANILDPRFTEVGIATAQGMYQGHLATFVAQEFGSPRTTPASAPAKVVVTRAPKAAASTTKPVTAVATTSKVLGEATPATELAVAQSPDAPAAAATDLAPSTWKESVERTLLEPAPAVRIFYIFAAAFIFLALGLLVFIEIRIQHARNIAYGMLLLIIIASFGYVSSTLLAPSFSIGQGAAAVYLAQ